MGTFAAFGAGVLIGAVAVAIAGFAVIWLADHWE